MKLFSEKHPFYRANFHCHTTNSDGGLSPEDCVRFYNDAGYDVSDFDSVLLQFDNIIGLDKLLCIHINDSKNVIGAHKDRHENIGFGYIGFDRLINVIYNKRLDGIPMILETPYVEKEYPPYREEIEMIRSKRFNSKMREDIVNK